MKEATVSLSIPEDSVILNPIGYKQVADVESFAATSSVYGPVHSWRLGWSLGIDLLVQSSICSFNCVYCQLGDIQVKTAERAIYVPTEKIERDLRLSDWEKADVVTFSGNGEPTLALNIAEVVELIKSYTHKPTMLLTNSTLLHDASVRRDVAGFDHIACKLDSSNDVILQRMNRPVAGVTHDSIVSGIEALRQEYTGKLSLQCMFMPTNEEDVEALALLVQRLQPDEVQLNTPKRPYPLSWIVENRGNHSDAIVESRTLRTISEPEADRIEALIRSSLDVPVISIYRR
jgi:wyosine [tRNA(Phe)-imidazoG37] synthetase (radical SAM superfamily)